MSNLDTLYSGVVHTASSETYIQCMYVHSYNAATLTEQRCAHTGAAIYIPCAVRCYYEQHIMACENSEQWTQCLLDVYVTISWKIHSFVQTALPVLPQKSGLRQVCAHICMYGYISTYIQYVCMYTALIFVCACFID